MERHGWDCRICASAGCCGQHRLYNVVIVLQYPALHLPLSKDSGIKFREEELMKSLLFLDCLDCPAHRIDGDPDKPPLGTIEIQNDKYSH